MVPNRVKRLILTFHSLTKCQKTIGFQLSGERKGTLGLELIMSDFNQKSGLSYDFASTAITTYVRSFWIFWDGYDVKKSGKYAFSLLIVLSKF